MKHVIIVGPGATRRAEADVVPGDTAEQVIRLVLPELGLTPGPEDRLFGADRQPLNGDVYSHVNDGDKLSLQQKEIGG